MSRHQMIRRLFVGGAAAVACLLALSSGVHAQSRNLLGNPGFESPRGDHPWMPAAWDTSRGNTDFVFFGRDDFSAHTGQFGVNVANASALLPLWHNWSQTLDVTPDMWGKDLLLTVWTKNNGVNGRGYIGLQAYRDTVGKMARAWKIDRSAAGVKLGLSGVNDPVIDLAWQRESFGENETGWTQRTLRVYLPPTTTIITVRMGLFGTGQVLFDDASLTLETAQPAVTPPLRTNLFRDPGFEGDALAWELSTPPFPPFVAERDTTRAHGGKASMHFSSEAGLVPAQSGVAQVFCNRALAGKRLRLSGYARSDSLRSSVFVDLFFRTRNGFTRRSSPETVFGTMDWTKLVLEADVPEETYQVWAWIEYTAPAVGHVWFDDASLEVLGPATGVQIPGLTPDAGPKRAPKRGTATPRKPGSR